MKFTTLKNLTLCVALASLFVAMLLPAFQVDAQGIRHGKYHYVTAFDRAYLKTLTLGGDPYNGTAGTAVSATAPGLNTTTLSETADGIIPAYRLAEVDSSADLVVGTLASQSIVGANLANASVASAATIKLGSGYVSLVSAAPITAGRPLKSADNGRVIGLLDSTAAGATIDTCAAGIAYTNQPADDGVELVSDDAGDTTQTATVIGTTNGGGVIVVETIALDGTTPVSTTKTDWGIIMAIKLDASCDGTITIREASADQAITTILTTVLSSGVAIPDAADQSAYGLAPQIDATVDSTILVGLRYQPVTGTGTALYQSKALNGTTAVTVDTAALTIEEIYFGAVEADETVLVTTNPTEEDEHNRIGKAVDGTTSTGATIQAALSI